MTEPIKVALEIDLDKYLVQSSGYDPDVGVAVEPTTIEGLVIDRAAQMMCDRAIGGGREGIADLRRRVQGVTETEIREAVRPLVEEALLSGIRKTNSYGDPIGEPMTLRAEIVRIATDYMNKPSDSYSRGKGTVVQQFVKTEVDKAVKAELKTALDEAKEEVVAAVRGQAATLITKTITDLAGVRA